ncbi:P-loop containing nucleoside triphosphate hydrolase protein [Zychaea mexicana]|uniref:P-loop containing nucleoside triphosphate hydrolase protein n=1 Tax=Zychaea mexicana TaxID=64656 RepID=UPI0022FED265|nr:P-loop containing nucleoside triphosphate hydrolase protein [Zychaea mexicana]KAI9499464.1 P-loop containing nucleoside triphosphate hydrolase protein [Zychaea mexicana]
MGRPLFEAHGISMRLEDGGRWLFKDIDFELNQREILALQGPSGTGKTTLLKCLAELVPYTGGYSKLRGKKPSEYGIPVWRSRVMYIPQRPTAHPGCPLDLFKIVKKYSSQTAKQHIGDPVQIGMSWNLSESHFTEKWSNLSGGEMQRCALAIALAFKPDVLLLDEPTSALDPDSAGKVEETLKKFACIWITHDARQADRVATRHIKLTRSQPPSPGDSENEHDNDDQHQVQVLTVPQDQDQDQQKKKSRRLSPSAFRGGLPVDVT